MSKMISLHLTNLLNVGVSKYRWAILNGMLKNSLWESVKKFLTSSMNFSASCFGGFSYNPRRASNAIVPMSVNKRKRKEKKRGNS